MIDIVFTVSYKNDNEENFKCGSGIYDCRGFGDCICGGSSARRHDREVESEDMTAMADGDLKKGDTFIKDDLQYTVRSDGTLEVSCPSDKKDTLKRAVIPSKVDGRSVTGIGYESFYNCTSLTKATNRIA